MAPQGTAQASNTLFHPIMPDRGQSLREPLGEGKSVWNQLFYCDGSASRNFGNNISAY